MHPDISVAILCGGKSKRFGSDKALHEFGGKPMYRHIWDKLSSVTDDIFLQVAKRNNALSDTMNEDLYPERGPLGGIASALLHAKHDRVFVVACDMPFLDVRIIDHLISVGEADIVVPKWRDGKTEPICALYGKSVAPTAILLSKEGPVRISKLFSQELSVRFIRIETLIEQGKLNSDCFINVNVPEDLEGRKP